MRTLASFMFGAILLTIVPHLSAQSVDRKGIEYFESKIRPVLVEHCYPCHSEEARKNRKLKADFLLDTRAGLLRGGVTGAAIVPGKPGESLLLKAMRHEGDLKMPRGGKLPATIVTDFEAWIKLGAPDPRDGKQTAAASSDIDWAKAREYWAFQAPVQHPLPKVKDSDWAKRDIDYFILGELEKRNLKPVTLANKRDLIRRATFDLIGLPPTPEEIDAFLKDNSPEAFAKVVDRLLASPHHGERWGRYWLDVARYAEDKALAFVTPRPHAYRYRDWVVQALNHDMPYDRFVRLQLAGDLVDDVQADYFVKLAGLGFQGLGQEYHRGSVAKQVIADELDDRIDTLSRGILGLTVACARCHDHKYDPIPTRDYYSLAAAYQGSSLTEIPLAAPTEIARFNAWKQEAKQLEAKRAEWLLEKSKAMSKQAMLDVDRYLLIAWKINVQRLMTYKDYKIPPPLVLDSEEHALALKEKLQPYFVQQAAFRTFKAESPLLAQWVKLAKVAERQQNGSVPLVIPDELQKAAAALKHQVAIDLERAGGDFKKGTPLLKELGTGTGGLFVINKDDQTKILVDADRQKYETITKDIENHKKSAPTPPAMAHGIRGGGEAMKINIRGNVERQGELAPPGFLRVLSLKSTEGNKFTRLELANAIADPKNPLTARVIVNRVWHYHFGRGIVGTTSNFGALGDRPTHPELLDTLAVRFMQAGWSLRWLHREMMLSTTYQLASTSAPINNERDPENQYLWRYAPRRLDFEAWRDAWLAVAGRLDSKRGGPSIELTQKDNVRRTLYAKVSRLEPNKLMVLFDFPDANVTSDRRSVTTVPQQQLFVLNSDFTIETAKAFANRLEKAAPKLEDRIGLAFRLAYGREPSAVEARASVEFVRNAGTKDQLTPWEQFAQAILASNEFLWID